MSYDIIETLVVESKKQMKPASIVLLEGDIQFTRYLPLEIPQKVMPKFADLKRYVQDFGRCAQRIQQDFILCGYYLNFIKREGLYRYCIHEGLQGYTNFYVFCEEVLPLKAKLDGSYVNGRFLGSDKQLSLYALEQMRSAIGRWSEGIKNTYGTEVMRFEMQNGRMDGSIEKKKYFKSYKKDYSKRNGSDCMASVFSSRAQENFIGLEDIAEYADYIATNDELLCQNSHMQEEMKRLQNEVDDMKNNVDMKPVEKQLAASIELLTQAQAGKTSMTEEAEKALRVLIKELCSVMSDWANEEEKE